MKTQDLKAALLTFAYQRPGFEFADYNSASVYRRDARKATRQLNDARAIAAAIPDTMPADYLLKELQSGNRLSLEDGRLRLCGRSVLLPGIPRGRRAGPC